MEHGQIWNLSKLGSAPSEMEKQWTGVVTFFFSLLGVIRALFPLTGEISGLLLLLPPFCVGDYMQVER